MRCCTVFEVPYEQTDSQRCPPSTRLPRRQTGGFTPLRGQVRGKGATAKQAEKRWPPLAGRSCFMRGLGINPERWLVWGWRVAVPCSAAQRTLPGLVHRAIRGEQERARLRRAHKPWEILERGLRGTAWKQDAQLCYLSMKKLGRTWPVSEKIDGIEAPSSLKARFRNIYISLDRDMKPD